jgi:CheY-like chemotaxis protein
MTALPKILIVDDDHDTLDLLEIILYKKYEVAIAMNGFEAIAKVKEWPPALIMTDIMMPVMDGVRLFNNLRKDEATRKLPVIAVTSFTGEYPEKSLTGMGFSGVIAKPPDATTVLAMVEKLLTAATGHP